MYTEREARELVVKAGLWLIEKGLVSRTWGNVSARISASEFIITPSGKAYEGLTPDDLVKVRIADCSYDGDVKPSSEKGVHAAVYSMRPEADFVIHTHQLYASACAADEKDLPYAPCAKYGLPGTDKLRKNVEKCVDDHRNHKTFLLAKHGTLVIGESVEDAYTQVEQLEINCKMEFESRIPSMDRIKSEAIDLDRFKTKDHPYVLVEQNEFVNECCNAGIDLKPYIDDFAQIAGPIVDVVKNKRMDIIVGLLGRNAVLVKGVGAVCVGASEEDVEAVATVTTKNCAAACYVRKSSPMSKADALLQRIVYLKKYSKLKDK